MRPFWIVNIQKKYASHVQVPLVQLGEPQERKVKPPVSESFEKDILMIVGGQSLERYHPQIICFALSFHGESPSA